MTKKSILVPKRLAHKKNRDREPDLRRVISIQQDFNKKILIVGEGVNTEPSYFEKFRKPGVTVVAVGLGMGTRKLVNEVDKVRLEEEKKIGVAFDEIWVAFDKDSFTDFDQAIQEAKNKGYSVAFSNQAIEYWFILHFKDHQGSAMPRSDYGKVLNELLTPYGIEYDPDAKVVTEDLFNLMYKNLQLAYDRATKIFNSKVQNGSPTEESVTTIHLLIHSITGCRTTDEVRNQLKKEESMKKAGIIE